jgi:hypothetical protein
MIDVVRTVFGAFCRRDNGAGEGVRTRSETSGADSTSASVSQNNCQPSYENCGGANAIVNVSSNVSANKSEGSDNQKYAQCMHSIPAMPADLAAIVTAWPALPEMLKAGIVAMVKASGC